LIEYVRPLENRDNWSRGQQVLAILRAMGIEATVQECRWLKIRNIIVDFSPDPEARRLLFSAHYDAIKGSPGANDNASGVAVLLGLCQELKHVGAPIRIIFFDREEAWLRTPVFRLGLLGSLYYVWKSKLRNVAVVYNLEFCGSGDFLGVWPIKSEEASLPVFKEIEKAATQLSLPFKSAHIPWPFLSSDHLSFRCRGISNALTLSLFPNNQVPVLENMLSGLSILRLLVGPRPTLPEPLSFIHTLEDTSSRLNENSLQLMLSLLMEMIRNYDQTGN
jgi:hypothetical protein